LESLQDSFSALKEKRMRTKLESEVSARFGVLPNFFRLTTDDPDITANLWGFAQFAYLDNPLPSLLKERLFVYLSLFCRVRYCIARHIGFLVGLGRPAGDPECLPQSIAEVLPLLIHDLPFDSDLDQHLALCQRMDLTSLTPEPNSERERAIFACAAHVFLKTPDASRALEALERVFDRKTLEYTKLLLAFIRTAHYWTEIHPELVLEDDINHLLITHEALAACVLSDAAELPENLLARRVSEELISLRYLKERESKLELDYDLLDTRYQKTEDRLFEREQDLHYLVALGSQIPWTADARGQLLYFEPRWLAWVGLSLDQVIGDKWLRVVHPDDVDKTREAWAHSVSTGEPLEIEYRIRDASESYVWACSRAVPRRDANKCIVKWYGTTENIEGRKKAEFALRKSEKLAALGRLANSIAHEVNNPLEAVTNLLFLSQTTDDQLVVKGYLRDADRELRRASMIAAQTLRFHKQSSSPSPVTCDELIASAVSLFHGRILGTSLRVEKRVRASRPVQCFEADVRQALSNFLSNAIDALSPRGGRILLRGREGTDWASGQRRLVITIADTGPGIDRHVMSQLFEPFVTTKGENRIGLGLWISRDIMARQQGVIRIKSSQNPKYHGTVVTLSLPLEPVYAGYIDQETAMRSTGSAGRQSQRASGGRHAVALDS
jgi:PAS domain S-box-containing protein